MHMLVASTLLCHTGHEFAALRAPPTALACWQVDLATPPTLSLRTHVHEARTSPVLIASLRTRRSRCAPVDVHVVQFMGTVTTIAIEGTITIVVPSTYPPPC